MPDRITEADIERAATLCAMVGGRPTADEWEFMRDFTRRAIARIKTLEAQIQSGSSR